MNYEVLLPLFYKVFSVENCISEFLTSLAILAVEVGEWYTNCAKVPMKPLTDEQIKTHKSATTCYICQRFLKTEDKVRDHDYVTGNYIGAAHNLCNLNRKQIKHLPVYFHNLRKYDMHHIIRYAGEAMKDWELSSIAQNSETFLALTARLPSKSTSTIRFLDSCQFLQSSLDAVTKMMSLNDFILSRQLAQ